MERAWAGHDVDGRLAFIKAGTGLGVALSWQALPSYLSAARPDHQLEGGGADTGGTGRGTMEGRAAEQGSDRRGDVGAG